MTDRLYIASEVTRRMNYIRQDALELGRLLRGEALSQGFHDSLLAIIRDLQRIADDSAPRRDTAQRPAEAAAPAPRARECVDAA